MKNIILPISIISLSLLFFLGLHSSISAQTNSDSIDAIGVRVAPNPNHFSIAKWYRSQGFYGSPQSLTVDGYEAIRDGRTVYVNAANVVGKDVYTNIYMISYNQNPSEKTVDILGQIISRWKFNTNMESDFYNLHSCSISSISCENDSDCGAGRFCADEGIAAGSCQLTEERNCRSDSDCPSGFYCNSDKAKITRDMKRIGMIGEMKEALANYYRLNGSYPRLTAGTYLSQATVSLWPSWKQVFLSDIAISPNFLDPINRLGSCPGYDQKTCWNNEANRFYSSRTADGLVLPEGSYAMVYLTDENGANYSLCATLESRHPDLGYNFAGSNLSESYCVSHIGVISGGSSENRAPYMVDYSLTGQPGKEFNGFIRVNDPDNDPLNWSISLGDANWSNWSSDALQILNTSNPYQKKIYARSAGLKPGDVNQSTFPITISVSDGRGDVLSRDLEIIIQDQGLYIEAQNARHILDEYNPLVYSFFVSGDGLGETIDAEIVKVSGPNVQPFFQQPTISKVSDGRFRVTYRSSLNPLYYNFPENTSFGFEARVTASGQTFSKPFSIELISIKPHLDFSCPLTARADKLYQCLISRGAYSKGINYENDYFPYYLNIERDNDDNVYLRGIAYKYVDVRSQIGSHQILIEAKSPYGATSSKAFNLQINTFCGDGVGQWPNTEGRGGANNDGYEQCDGLHGTTQIPSESSIDRQYACSTGPNANTPAEITTRNFCVFADSANGGGYCGDGICQIRYEDKYNCPSDCSDDSPIIQTGTCSSDSDCDGEWLECNAMLKTCGPKMNRCVVDSDCGAGNECNLNTYYCEAISCVSNSDCESGFVCDMQNEVCVPEDSQVDDASLEVFPCHELDQRRCADHRDDGCYFHDAHQVCSNNYCWALSHDDEECESVIGCKFEISEYDGYPICY